MGRCRLIYKSISTEEIIANEAVSELVERSALNNRRDGITGLLLLSGDRFLQVLEGDSEKVNRLYAKIIRDERHHSLALISYKSTETSFFEDWSMRLVDLYDLPGDSRQFLTEKYRHRDGEIKIPDTYEEVFALLLDARTLVRKM